MAVVRAVVALRPCDWCKRPKSSVKHRPNTIHWLCASCWAKKKARRRNRERAAKEGTQ